MMLSRRFMMMSGRRNSNNCQNDVSIETSQKVPRKQDDSIKCAFRISNSPHSDSHRHSSCSDQSPLLTANARNPGLTVSNALEASHPKRSRLFPGVTEAFLKATVTIDDDDNYHCPYQYKLTQLPNCSSLSQVGVLSDPDQDDVTLTKTLVDAIFFQSTSELEELEVAPIMMKKTINDIYSELIRSQDRHTLLSC